jgi:hypothetical protein
MRVEYKAAFTRALMFDIPVDVCPLSVVEFEFVNVSDLLSVGPFLGTPTDCVGQSSIHM